VVKTNLISRRYGAEKRIVFSLEMLKKLCATETLWFLWRSVSVFGTLIPHTTCDTPINHWRFHEQQFVAFQDTIRADHQWKNGDQKEYVF